LAFFGGRANPSRRTTPFRGLHVRWFPRQPRQFISEYVGSSAQSRPTKWTNNRALVFPGGSDELPSIGLSTQPALWRPIPWVGLAKKWPNNRILIFIGGRANPSKRTTWPRRPTPADFTYSGVPDCPRDEKLRDTTISLTCRVRRRSN
jgi:hypothetical protein